MGITPFVKNEVCENDKIITKNPRYQDKNKGLGPARIENKSNKGRQY